MNRTLHHPARKWGAVALAGILSVGTLQAASSSPTKSSARSKPPFPPYTEVFKGYSEVISTIDRARPLMSLWVRPKDNQALVALPRGFERKRLFIAMTVASGEKYAGLQAGELYVYLRPHNKSIVMVTKNLAVRSSGDPQSKASVKRLFTDKVVTDMPILTVLTNWGR
jgi:hypothetical protein